MKKTLTHMAVLAIAAQGLFTTAAFADAAPRSPLGNIQNLDFDTDDDGQVTVGEFDAFWAQKAEQRAQKFADKRAERDAKRLARENRRAEREAAHPERGGKNRPTRPEKIEKPKMPTPRVMVQGAQVDTNDDGVLSKDELSVAKKTFIDQKKQQNAERLKPGQIKKSGKPDPRSPKAEHSQKLRK